MPETIDLTQTQDEPEENEQSVLLGSLECNVKFDCLTKLLLPVPCWPGFCKISFSILGLYLFVCLKYSYRIFIPATNSSIQS
jgi:hypothetical protein